MYHADSSVVAPYNHLPFKVPFHFSDFNFDSPTHASPSPHSPDVVQPYAPQALPNLLDFDALHQNLFYSRYNIPFSKLHQNCCSQDTLTNATTSTDSRHLTKYAFNDYSKAPPHELLSNSERTILKGNRKRSCHINSAFSALRECIPNVPTDTKLSKIKTLRLATSYIAYLMDVLRQDDPSLCASFDAVVVKKSNSREIKREKEIQVCVRVSFSTYPSIFQWVGPIKFHSIDLYRGNSIIE